MIFFKFHCHIRTIHLPRLDLWNLLQQRQDSFSCEGVFSCYSLKAQKDVRIHVGRYSNLPIQHVVTHMQTPHDRACHKTCKAIPVTSNVSLLGTLLLIVTFSTTAQPQTAELGIDAGSASSHVTPASGTAKGLGAQLRKGVLLRLLCPSLFGSLWWALKPDPPVIHVLIGAPKLHRRRFLNSRKICELSAGTEMTSTWLVTGFKFSVFCFCPEELDFAQCRLNKIYICVLNSRILEDCFCDLYLFFGCYWSTGWRLKWNIYLVKNG